MCIGSTCQAKGWQTKTPDLTSKCFLKERIAIGFRNADCAENGRRSHKQGIPRLACASSFLFRVITLLSLVLVGATLQGRELLEELLRRFRRWRRHP